MAETKGGYNIWDTVMDLTKWARLNNTDPNTWAIQLTSILNKAHLTLPSVQLSHVLVSHICWDNNNSITWKYLYKALSSQFVSPVLVLALLSLRVIPARRVEPAAYRLYLELVKRYYSAGCFGTLLRESNYQEILKAVDDALHLSDIFGIQDSDPAVLSVLAVFSNVWQLVEASLDDEGLLEYSAHKSSRWLTGIHGMEIDKNDHFLETRVSNQEGMLKTNSSMAVEMILQSLQSRVTSQIVFLVRQNMPSIWKGFYQNLELLASKSSAVWTSKQTTPEAFAQMVSDMCKHQCWQNKTILQCQFHATMASGSFVPSSVQCHGVNCSSLWLPIDLILEDALEGIVVSPTCAIDTLTDMVKSLQVLYSATWHETFLGLWISTLRLVQRERNPFKGPVARLETCLCMLFSIIPLVLINLIDEDKTEFEFSQSQDKQALISRRHELVSCLQQLGEYEDLLTPPSSIAPIANQAAIKAVLYLSGFNITTVHLESVSVSDLPINCAGNLHHLIVEACISRNLLDYSAYAWPGFVNARINQIPHVSAQAATWSSLLKGTPLTSVLVNALVSTPASSLAEIEKIYEIAAGGSDDEKISAATILCGSSLIRGWNVQEHIVHFIVRLLSPPMPAEYSGSESPLIAYGPFFNVLLAGIATIDIIQIFRLHGLVPYLSGVLMPICEVFGSCSSKISWSLTTGEEINSHAVFSNAFTLLLRLWSFDHIPLEQAMGDVPSVAFQQSPEYLLRVRNSQLASLNNAASDQCKRWRFSNLIAKPSSEPIFLDSFPKLNCWYRQHRACIASPLSGLIPGSPVHQSVQALLNMIFKRMRRGTNSESSTSSSSSIEEAVLQLQLSAWDILEALPFVLDAALTACAHDKLSPRDLITGLKDLADFLPASLASILSYFSAEVTRGVWKPASMNGTDWPSPAVNLSFIERQIHEILAATGIDVPSLAPVGNSTPTLPLPLAALLSLTITYKVDKNNERYLDIFGRGVVVLAACCPWPCMPIVSALWVQKAKHWSDFLIFAASRTVFNLNNDAIVQLLRSCFSSILGFNSFPRSIYGGVGGLLGHGLGTHSNGISPVPPGIFFLRVSPFFRNITLVTQEIISLLIISVNDIINGFSDDTVKQLKKSKFGTKYKQASLSSAMSHVKLAASVGASFVWISGGANLHQIVLKETLPSWFITSQRSETTGEPVVSILSGYALAYFAILCGLFAWGIDSNSLASTWRSKILTSHLEFMATALEGKISLRCDVSTWRAYVSGYLGLLVRCVPAWLLEVDVCVLKNLSKGLRQFNEEELAISLASVSGMKAMGVASELIIQSAPV